MERFTLMMGIYFIRKIASSLSWKRACVIVS
jgi:hypothetical protein